jgi:iron-sulfur cluster repair protein YtfE (RIC family)
MTTDVAVDVPRERRPLPRERHLLAVATMNAIELLKAQHKKTKAALEKASEAKLDSRESKKAADELVAHMVIEEHVFYPRVRELMKDMVGESYEEHTVARFALARALLARGEEQIKARFTVLKELIEHHVEEEEKEMFPKVQKGIPSEELERLGARMQAMFEQAVELGLEQLVTGAEHTLRSPSGRMNGHGRSKTPSRSMRAAR